jgi:hypothetical protein
VYAGGTFSRIGGQWRSRIAAVDAASGTATAWNPSADAAVYALAVSGSTVYAGGGFHSIGGQPRNHIGALGAASGMATPWNPNAAAEVSALALSGPTVYASGSSLAIGGLPQAHVAGISIDGPQAHLAGVSVGASSFVRQGGDLFQVSLGVMPNPVRDQVTVAFTLEAATPVALEVYDVSGRRIWNSPRTMLDPGRQALSWNRRNRSGGTARSGVYFLRLNGAGIEFTQRVVVLD